MPARGPKTCAKMPARVPKRAPSLMNYLKIKFQKNVLGRRIIIIIRKQDIKSPQTFEATNKIFSSFALRYTTPFKPEFQIKLISFLPENCTNSSIVHFFRFYSICVGYLIPFRLLKTNSQAIGNPFWENQNMYVPTISTIY